MLFSIIERVTAKIRGLEVERLRASYLAQMRQHVRAFDELVAKGAPGEVVDKLGLALAEHLLGLIKTIPPIAEKMTEAIKNPATELRAACLMASALVYLAHPRDLLPDELPGGFGFSDDYVVLMNAQLELGAAHAGEDQGALATPATLATLATLRRHTHAMSAVLPAAIKPGLQAVVHDLTAMKRVIGELPTTQQQMALASMIANPGQIRPVGSTTSSPSAAAFAPEPLAIVWEGGTWQTGATIGLAFPGGGGVTWDGRRLVVS